MTFFKFFRRIPAPIVLAGAAIVMTVSVGAENMIAHAAESCARCDEMGCSCPVGPYDGGDWCELHSSQPGGFFDWLRGALSGSQDAPTCECIEVGDCRVSANKKLDPEIGGSGEVHR